MLHDDLLGTSRRPREPEREDRITMEIVVDAYNEMERQAGWHAYLEDALVFPFTARCIVERLSSPLAEGEEVEVVGMAPCEECETEMLVVVEWQGRPLAVPLAQIEPIDADPDTRQAVEDWRYWVERNYHF